MRYKIVLAAILLAVMVGFVPAQSQVDKKKMEKIKEHMLFNSAQGREFWIAIPANEVSQYSQTRVLEIYVTASKKTNVTLESPGMGVYITKPVEPLKITTFSSVTGECTYMWEVRESEVVLDKGLRLFADQPISVYVLNAKVTTSEGYLGIPTSALGTDYIHCSYYDFDEVREWASGFIIISTMPRTRADIQLRGVGYGYATTMKGRDMGDSWSTKKMDPGQVYYVRGNGKTRGQFDMTGSRITANNPIGLISTHMRTIIPVWDINNGRDHLAEMMPPVTAWGKNYATVEYKRPKRQGDYFRIVGSEDDTHFKCKYYDIGSNKQLGTWEGWLDDGEYAEYLEVPVRLGHGLSSIKGMSVFEMDKPALVMQYSYSANWDGDPIFDPFMILVVPVEQFIPATVFQTPANDSFNTNHFNIIAVGDTSDKAHEDLKSIKLDGRPIWNIDGSFILNRIPTTNLYWAKIDVQPGAHKVEGDTKFGGYIYGFSQFDSYGWPAAMALNKLDETDTLEPELSYEEDCGDYTIVATEVRNGVEGDDPLQVDQGISQIELLEDSYNYELDLPDPFETWPPLYEYTFFLKVKDKFRSGFAIYAVTDRAGNTAIDSVRYSADSLELDPSRLVFGNVRLNTSKLMTATLTNTSDSVVNVTSIKLKFGEFYIITEGEAPPEFDLMPGESHEIKVQYTPTEEGLEPDDLDIDSILVENECLTFSWPIEGRGVVPRIWVEDWDAGAVTVGKTLCKEEATGTGLLIENQGTDTLTITGFENIQAPFTLSDPTDPPLPIKIAPHESIELKSVCFTPEDTNKYSFDILIHSDAEGVDSISNWKGRGLVPGPYITSMDWHKKRRLTVNESTVKIGNVGNDPIRVSDVNLETADPNFSIDKDNIKPKLPVTLWPEGSSTGVVEIIIPVIYEPQTEEVHHVSIVPEFDDENITVGSVYGNLDGIGIEPKITVTGYEFQPAVKVNNQHPDVGKVVIKSVSESAPLYIESIEWSDPAQNDFTWVNTPPSDVTLNQGESIELDVTFLPDVAMADIVEHVTVVSDRGPGPDPDPRRENDTVVIGHSYETGIEVGFIDYGSRLLCDSPVDSLFIENTAATTDMYIDDIQLISGDVGYFELLSKPDVIPATETAYVMYRFIPDADRDFRANVQIDYHYDGLDNTIYETETYVEGSGYSVTVNFDLPELINIAPGMGTGEQFTVNVNSNQWNDAEVTTFIVEVKYNMSWMKWAGENGDEVKKGGVLPDSWTVNAAETYDYKDSIATLTFYGETTNPMDYIKSNGILVIPNFILMLNSTGDFTPDFGDITFDVRDACVNKVTSPGRIVFQICVQDLRNVVINAEEFGTEAINPNPVGNNGFDFNFTMGLEVDAKIEVYNSSSELVKLVSNKNYTVGKHTEFVETSDLGSGVYFVRITAGPFTSTERLVIAK